MNTIFTTASGTTYRIFGETNTLVRELPSEDQWSESAGTLRRDGEHIDILSHSEIEVGHQAVFVLDVRRDGIKTVRTTNTVTSIRTED